MGRSPIEKNKTRIRASNMRYSYVIMHIHQEQRKPQYIITMKIMKLSQEFRYKKEKKLKKKIRP